MRIREDEELESHMDEDLCLGLTVEEDKEAAYDYDDIDWENKPSRQPPIW